MSLYCYTTCLVRGQKEIFSYMELLQRRHMAKKRKGKRAGLDVKGIEKRLERYGNGEARDKFGKKTNQLAKAQPLSEIKS